MGTYSPVERHKIVGSKTAYRMFMEKNIEARPYYTTIYAKDSGGWKRYIIYVG